MKTVFDNYECAHVFASGTQSNGRSNNGNLFFQGNTIYSYGSHFPIATRINGKWLFNADSYSFSTSKHQSIVRSALNHVELQHMPDLATVVDIANARDKELKKRDAMSYCKARAADIERLSDSITRMRADWKKSNARAEIAKHESAANFVWHELAKRRGDPLVQAGKLAKQEQRKRKIGQFKAGRADIEKIIADDPESIIDNWEKIKPANDAEWFYWQNWSRVIKEQRDRIFRDTIGPMQIKESRRLLGVEWSESTRQLQLERDEKFAPCHEYVTIAEKIANEQWEKINAAKLEDWLSGESNNAPRGGIVRCRVKDDVVETSQGARVPLSHAKRLVRFAAVCRKNGNAWRRNGETKPVGIYQTDRIDADGTLHIGCHHIPWDSVVDCVNRFVPELLEEMETEQ